MATLEDRLEELILELGTDWKTLMTIMFGSITGSLADLDTSDKTSLVHAINEVEAQSGSGATNLGTTPSPTQVVITSDTGADATMAAADATNAGVMTKAMFDKLTGIEAAADVTDAGNVGSSIHGAAAKTTPVGADTIALIDSEAANALKKMTIANLTTYVIAEAGAGAPALLNTIDEIAAALGDAPDTITNLLTTVSLKANSADVYTKVEIDAMLGDPDNDLVAAYTAAKA